MKYAYFPGCSLRSTAREYDASFRAVCDKLGIELYEPKKWICCGSSFGHAFSKLLMISLPLQNLKLVEMMDLEEVVVPCASCFSRFKSAQSEVKSSPDLLEKVKKIIGKELTVDINVCHPLEIFSRTGILNETPKFIKRDISGLKVACYYGCLLTRPPKVMQFDECEYPQSMDKILQAFGIETIDWAYKTECCGAAFSLTRSDIVRKLSFEILKEAKQLGADAIAAACPLCHANLDMRQEEIEKEYGIEFKMPILYFTQLMGLGFGIPAHKLLLQKHMVSTDRILNNV